MANVEYNNTVFDNTAQTFNSSPDNTTTSDELLAGEVYDYEHETNFAKAKRVAKAIKIVFFTITISVTGGAIVVGLTRSNVGSATPKIEEPVFNVENKVLYYSFNLTNLKNYKVTFTILNKETEIYKVVLEKEQTYSNSYDLSKYSGSMSASLDYSNDVDHFGNLYKYPFTL